MLVVDDESDIDLMSLPVALNGYGVGMAADLVVRLEQHNLIVPLQKTSDNDSRHARADYRDSHKTFQFPIKRSIDQLVCFIGRRSGVTSGAGDFLISRKVAGQSFVLSLQRRVDLVPSESRQ